MSDLSKVCDRLGDDAAPIVLQATVADLNGYWLELCCARHGVTLLPVRLIMERQGGADRLAAVLARFGCKVCHAPPVSVHLNETHNRTFNNGAPPGWSVQLIPAAIARNGEAAE